MNRFMNQSGFGTVMAIIMVAVLSGVIVVLGPMMDQTARANKQTKDEIDAQFAAEAGIQYALALAKKDVTLIKTLDKKLGMDNGSSWHVRAEKVPLETGLYLIRSTGEAGSVKKLSRETNVKIKINDEKGLLYNYEVYAGGDLSVHSWADIYKNPEAKGKMGALGSIEVRFSGPRNFAGIDGIKDEITGWIPGEGDFCEGGAKPPAWYQKKTAKEIGSLSVSKDLEEQIQKWEYANQGGKPNLPNEKYSSITGPVDFPDNQALWINGKMSINSATIKAKELVLFIDNDLDMYDANITADSVTIYAKRGIKIGNSMIKADKIQIYTEDTFEMNNNGLMTGGKVDDYSEEFKLYAYRVAVSGSTNINAKEIEIKVDRDEKDNSTGSFTISEAFNINKDLKDGIAKIYGKHCITISNTTTIGCDAVIVFDNKVDLRNTINAAHTIFISGNDFLLDSSGNVAGVYAVNNMILSGGSNNCIINKDGKKNDVLKRLGDAFPGASTGMSGTDSQYTVVDGSWQLPNDENTDNK